MRYLASTWLLCLLACDGEVTAEPHGSGADPAGVGGSATGPTCAPGELQLADGSCTVAGIAPPSCGEGFVADDDGGCVAVLPRDPCAPGTLAVPGDTSCKPVAPCGEGTWGDIPTDEATEYVDGSYRGSDSDGTQSAPWPTIQQAIDAAAPGAVVAVAAGDYQEDVLLLTKPVQLWGVCPALAGIHGSGEVTLEIGSPASGSAVHAIGISGGGTGINVTHDTEVSFDRIWIHDTGSNGLRAQFATATVTDSLVEKTAGGILAHSGYLTVDRCVVRDTTHSEEWRSIAIGMNDKGPAAAVATIRGSVVERTEHGGISVGGAKASIETTVVRDTGLDPDSLEAAYAIAVEHSLDGTIPAEVTLRTSVVERTRGLGVFVDGSVVSIEQTVVRDTQPTAAEWARGIHLQTWVERGSLPAVVSVTESLVEGTVGAGIVSSGAELHLDRTIVRRTKAWSDGTLGDGIMLISEHATATGTMEGCRVEQNDHAGVLLLDGQLSVGTTAFACNALSIAAVEYDGASYEYQDLGGNSCGCEQAAASCDIVETAPPWPAP